MQLRSKPQTTKRKKMIIAASAVAVFMLGYLMIAYAYKLFPFQGPAVSISDEVKQRASDAKNDKTSETVDDLPNDDNTTSQEVPVNPDASVIITETGQAGGFVTASAKASGEGTCVFQYTTDGDRPVTQEIATSDGNCSSSVRDVEFSKLGTWKLTVIFYDDGKKVETSQDVTIN